MKDDTRKAMAAVHACRKQVAGLDDDEAWRAFLERVTGKRSLRELDGRGLGRVIDALHAAGAPRRAAGRAGTSRRRYAETPQMGKARALWITLHQAGVVRDPSEKALGAFVRKVTGQDMGALTAAAGTRVIEALKAMAARHGVALET